jgi:prepilin-type N-terminal cleavage/methylation domain-containing protein
MISQKIKVFHKNRAGFTLIEILVTLVITGLIGLGASIASAQVLNQTSKNTDYTTASRNAMNAIHWISRDALMAQTINGTTGFPLTQDLSMKWTGWNNSSYTANYTLASGQLQRIYSDSTVVTTTVIAEHINPDMTSADISSDNVTITLTVTSSVGEGDRVIDVTRVREIASRPKL